MLEDKKIPAPGGIQTHNLSVIAMRRALLLVMLAAQNYKCRNTQLRWIGPGRFALARPPPSTQCFPTASDSFQTSQV